MADPFTKQPSESYDLAFDFTGKLPSGRTLASGTLAATELASGADATGTVLLAAVAAIDVSANQALLRVQSGADGTDYKLTCVVTLDDGQVLEEDVIMQVREL